MYELGHLINPSYSQIVNNFQIRVLDENRELLSQANPAMLSV